MYLPKLFKSENNELLKQIVAENAFSSLIMYKEKILSTKAMMLINESKKDTFFIETHLHKANPIAIAINEGDEVLCDFIGVNTYISSSWYNHVNASTWNYEQVQIYGKVVFMNDDELYNHLYKLTNQFEALQKCPMTAEKIGKEFIEREMKGTLGINVVPTEIKIKQKLSQNRDEENYSRIIEKLENSNSLSDKKMALKMKNLKSN